jgi:hypothetical protein
VYFHLNGFHSHRKVFIHVIDFAASLQKIPAQSRNREGRHSIVLSLILIGLGVRFYHLSGAILIKKSAPAAQRRYNRICLSAPSYFRTPFCAAQRRTHPPPEQLPMQ